MLVSWITGGRCLLEKTGETYARNGQVSSTNDWCVDAVFSGELFACFWVKNTKKWVFWGFGQRSDFEKHMQHTKVTKKGVRDSCLGLFCGTHGGVCFHVLNLVGVMCLYSAEWMTRLFLFEERQAFEPTSTCWYELMLCRCQTSKNLQDG